jgi:hypothetical protein
VLNSLAAKLQEMKMDRGWRELASFNVGRWEAFQALEQNKVLLMQAQSVGPGGDLQGSPEVDYFMDNLDGR